MIPRTYEIARSSLNTYHVPTAWDERCEGKHQWKIPVPYGVITVSYIESTNILTNANKNSLVGTYYSAPCPFTDEQPYQFANNQQIFHRDEDIDQYEKTWQLFFARVLHKMDDGVRHHMTLLSLYEVLYDKKLMDYPSWTTHITNELDDHRGRKRGSESEKSGHYYDSEFVSITKPKLYATMSSLRFKSVFRNPHEGLASDVNESVNEPKFVLDNAKAFTPTDKRVVWEPMALTKEVRYSMDGACSIRKMFTVKGNK